jgi:predicted RNA-binding Zn ribbon-like protein
MGLTLADPPHDLAMDAAELARIAKTMVAAIAEARALAKEVGIGTHFREVTRHAREMYDLLVEAIVANEPLATDYLRDLVLAAGTSIEQLETLAAMPDGKMQ